MLVFIRAVLQKLETSTGGSDSDRRMFLISVEQLRMNTNILSVQLYLSSKENAVFLQNSVH
jgi:hypothetical protein